MHSVSLALLRLLSVSHLKRSWVKVSLTVCGIALGVAVSTAITIASDTAERSFENATAFLKPTAGTVVGSTVGRVPEAVLPALRALPGVQRIVPFSSRVVAARADGRSLGTVRVVGTDLFGVDLQGEGQEKTEGQQNREDSLALFRHPPFALVSKSLAEAFASSTLVLDGGKEPLQVAVLGVAPRELPERTVFLDISIYQELFSDFQEVDHVEVVSSSPLPTTLPPPLQAVDPTDRSAQALLITEAFRVNLRFLSFISLLVTILLIYNTVSYTVLQRRRELGILRALGAPRKTLFSMVLTESVLLGGVGSLVGVALGSLLSVQMAAATTQTISTLYTPITTASPTLSPFRLLASLLLGPVVAFLGALLPALEASAVETRETFSLQTYEERFRSLLPRFEVFGALLLLCGWLTCSPHLLEKNVLFGFLPPLFFVGGVLVFVPRILLILTKAPFGYLAALAADHIQCTLRRSSVAVGAMTISLGLVLGVSVMIESFRGTVSRWIQHIIAADLYISGGTHVPEESIQELIQLPQVALFDWISYRDLALGGRKVRVQGTRFEVLQARGRYTFFEPLSDAAVSDPSTVLVSEPFARRFQKTIGSELELPTLTGTKRVRITNIFYDYASDQGIILMPFAQYEELFGPSRKNGLSLYLKEGVLKDPEALTAFELLLAERFPALTVTTNRSLRAEVLRIFDQTFAVTYALQAIAVVISLLTIVNTVFMLLLERKREFGVLRAIGASQRTVVKVVSAEAVLLGAGASVGACLLGGALSVVLVFVINRHFFGWSIEYELHGSTLLGVVVTTVSLAALCGAVPGWWFARRLGANEVRYE